MCQIAPLSFNLIYSIERMSKKEKEMLRKNIIHYENQRLQWQIISVAARQKSMWVKIICCTPARSKITFAYQASGTSCLFTPPPSIASSSHPAPAHYSWDIGDPCVIWLSSFSSHSVCWEVGDPHIRINSPSIVARSVRDVGTKAMFSSSMVSACWELWDRW